MGLGLHKLQTSLPAAVTDPIYLGLSEFQASTPGVRESHGLHEVQTRELLD